jgi:hypothetical protein
MAQNTGNSMQECKLQAVNRRNKDKEMHASNMEPSASRSEQETFHIEQTAYSNPVQENKENMCVGNSDLLALDAIKDLLNIVHAVSIHCTLGEFAFVIIKQDKKSMLVAGKNEMEKSFHEWSCH